jgi:hypothetical protein
MAWTRAVPYLSDTLFDVYTYCVCMGATNKQIYSQATLKDRSNIQIFPLLSINEGSEMWEHWKVYALTPLGVLRA